jgi:methionyl-tRNA synthetase
MDEIKFDDFAKVEFKIGEIKKCEKVKESEKLLRMEVDFGEETLRVVYAGIAKSYEPEGLINKKTVFVANVKPRKIMGELSQAMIFAGSNEEKVSLLFLDKDLPIGAEVY